MTRIQPVTGAVAPEIVASRIAQQDPIPAKVLVADHDRRNLLVASEALRTPGLDVVLADCGETALRRMLTDDFAAVLVAAQMPRIDGCELAAMIRGRERSAQVPIIFLTTTREEVSRALRHSFTGAVDYVSKPIEPSVLRSKVSLLVDLYRKGEQERRLLRENLHVHQAKRRAEQALRRREGYQSLVLGSLPIALYTASISTQPRRLRFMDGDLQRVTGFTARDVATRADLWETRVHPDDLDRVLRALDSIEETGTVSIEYRFRCPDGIERCIFDQCVLERDADGGPREVFGLWVDVTERRRLESNLLHASKLEAIGRLTGGVAHDFNNMLAVAIGSLELLQTCVGESEARRRAQVALEAARGCADLTRRLLAFSRHRSPDAGSTDLRTIVPAMLEMVQPVLGDRVDVRLDMPQEIRPVSVDRSQLEAALLSLAANARETMPAGGRLSVSVADVPGDPAAAEGGGDYVEIAISDTGSGGLAAELEQDAGDHAPTNGGTAAPGLRLIVGLLQQSGGEVRIERTPDGRRTVRLLLPSRS